MSGVIIHTLKLCWDQRGHALRIEFDPPSALVLLAVSARGIVSLDADGNVLDIDLVGLPSYALPYLTQYSVGRATNLHPSELALDLDAAWLWIHLAEGQRATRRFGLARLELDIYAGVLVRLDIRFPTSSTEC
jgi:hypothetical protein